MPAIVVQDTENLTALYWQSGTHWKDVSKHASAQEVLASTKLTIVDHVWEETDVLFLALPGESYAVWLMWEQGQGKLRCWYINLETPLLRTPIGFDTMDHELDIVIRPDRSEWRWKDEEAFREWEAAGVYSAGEALEIRAEGERVLQRLKANLSPFGDGWEEWRPPSGWVIPVLPHDWDMEIEESLMLR